MVVVELGKNIIFSLGWIYYQADFIGFVGFHSIVFITLEIISFICHYHLFYVFLVLLAFSIF